MQPGFEQKKSCSCDLLLTNWLQNWLQVMEFEHIHVHLLHETRQGSSKRSEETIILYFTGITVKTE